MAKLSKLAKVSDTGVQRAPTLITRDIQSCINGNETLQTTTAKPLS